MDDSGVASGVDGPVLGTREQFPERPPGRGRLVPYLIIGIIVAIAMGGWGYVMMSAKGSLDAPNQLISFEVSGSSSVTVTFQVHKAADRAAVCKLRATDPGHVEVGTRDVTIPPGESDVQLTERVETSARATSGHVQYCYLVQ